MEIMTGLRKLAGLFEYMTALAIQLIVDEFR